MKRKARFPLLKVTLNVYKQDWEKLSELHGDLGPSHVVRELIHAHVMKVEQRQTEIGRALTSVEIDGLV